MSPSLTFILSTTSIAPTHGNAFRSRALGRPLLTRTPCVRPRVISPIFIYASSNSDNSTSSESLQIDAAAAERAINQSIPVVPEVGETANVVADIVSSPSPANLSSSAVPVTPPQDPAAPELLEETADVSESSASDIAAVSSIELEAQGVDSLETSVENQPAVAREAPLESSVGETDTGLGRPGGMRRRRRRTRSKRDVKYQLEDLVIGMELEGVVRSVTDYGAFVSDLGTPTDGLIHVSQLSKDFVENVKDVVSEGDKVNVRVLGVNLEKKTISLTLKTKEDMDAERAERRENLKASASARREEEAKKKWEDFTYDTDTFVDAKVLVLTEFGAFCALLDENGERSESAPTDCLIHISELKTERVEKVSDVLSVGDVIKARIVAADPKRNRISLSLKPVPSPEEVTEASVKKSERKSERRKDKAGNREDSVNVEEEMKKAEAAQPEFKTSFELAFEQAQARFAKE